MQESVQDLRKEQPLPQELSEVADIVLDFEAPPGVSWYEIRCHQCDRLLVKFTGSNDSQIVEVAKICIEGWCRHCKVPTYKLIVL